jgi:hypothetical protein
MNWLIARFKEPSTWLAISGVAISFFGQSLLPDQKENLQLLAAALFGSGLFVSKG